MIRGTTPTNTFEISLDTAEIAEVEVIYSQNGVVVFEKHTADCEMSGKVITTKLTQEETWKLDDKVHVEIQLFVKTYGGDVIASDIMITDVERCLKDGVM